MDWNRSAGEAYGSDGEQRQSTRGAISGMPLRSNPSRNFLLLASCSSLPFFSNAPPAPSITNDGSPLSHNASLGHVGVGVDYRSSLPLPSASLPSSLPSHKQSLTPITRRLAWPCGLAAGYRWFLPFLFPPLPLLSPTLRLSPLLPSIYPPLPCSPPLQPSLARLPPHTSHTEQLTTVTRRLA